MRETFGEYLQRLKKRRTEDDYKYTDEDFIKYQLYITDCWLTNLSVYKCLEFMWFETEEGKQETLEQIASKQFQKDFNKEVGKVLVQQLNK